MPSVDTLPGVVLGGLVVDSVGNTAGLAELMASLVITSTAFCTLAAAQQG